MKINKKTKYIIVGGILMLLLFLLPVDFVLAVDAKTKIIDPESDKIARFMSWIVVGFISALGVLLTVLLKILNALFAVQDFDINGVTIGWVAVRDLCNMFFILVLLLIAFATILRVESYSVKRLLPKLIIMAVMINFSKTICFLLIDFSQVITLTFANTFVGAEGNFINALGIHEMMNISTSPTVKVDDWAIFGSMLMALIFIIITGCVFVMFIVILVSRLVMFWVLVVLSPMAFFSSIIPSGSGFFSKWWGEFSKYLIVGPVLAFFTWLSLVIIDGAVKDLIGDNATDLSAGPSKIGEWKNVYNFVLSIGMLIGALKITQGLGVAGGNVGMNMANSMKNKGLAAGRGTVKLAGKGVKAYAGYKVDNLRADTGVDLNLKRSWDKLSDARAKNRADKYDRGTKKAADVMAKGGRIHGMLAMTGNTGDAWNQISTGKGRAQRLKGGARMTKDREAAEKRYEEKKGSYDEDKAFLGKGTDERSRIANQLEIDSVGLQTKIDGTSSSRERKKLIAEKEVVDEKKEFANEYRTADGDKIKTWTKNKEEELKEPLAKIQDEIDANIPTYSKGARSADNKMVAEKQAEIKDITDGTELARILREAMKEKDIAMIKAVSKRMAQDGDLNDILAEHAEGGNTGLKGLHSYISGLQNSGAMSEQESRELGADLSHIAKGNNQWAMANAYQMKNGSWDENTEEDQAKYVKSETAKGHTQKLLRENGRLAYGEYTNDEYEINLGGVQMLKTLDSKETIDKVRTEMQVNTAINLVNGGGEFSLDKLEMAKIISPLLAKAIRERAESGTGKGEFESHEQLKKKLAKINQGEQGTV